MFGNREEMLKQLQSDPLGAAKKAGFNVPDEIANDPKAMVMHLVNSGQVGGQMLQRIMPMIRQLTGK